MYKKILTLLLLSGLLQASTLTIALAANVSYAMPSLEDAFNKHYPDIHIKTIISGSGKLTAQIKRGAPYDLFLSANMRYPEALYKEHLALQKPKVYAQGALALLSQKPRNFSNISTLLESSKIRKIAMANPKTAPYGKAALEALTHLHLYKKLKHKLIFGESIAQTVTYTMTAADLGFIAKSALFSPHMKRFQEGKNFTEVPKNLYNPIKQGIVILSRSHNITDAQKFYNFMLSDEAKTILQHYGYNI
jgi:molybdate transport system substrate-binding protein